MKPIANVAAALFFAFALGSAAAAPVTYDFTFTDTDVPGRIDATGTFVTGDAAQDAGYFLLTSLTFTSLLVGSGLQTGSAVQTDFSPGAAYDPTTGAFLNHFLANTYDNYGGGTAVGLLGKYTRVILYPDDFSQASPSGAFIDGTVRDGSNFDDFGFNAELSIVVAPMADPGSVPEPGTVALIGFGLVGLAASRRSSKR